MRWMKRNLTKVPTRRSAVNGNPASHRTTTGGAQPTRVLSDSTFPINIIMWHPMVVAPHQPHPNAKALIRAVYEVRLFNNETGYEKGFYYKNYFTFECSPSIYSPSLATNLSILFFHWSKQCWKSFLVRAFRRSAVFCFTASIDSNRVPFKTAFIFGNKKKSHGAKSGECVILVQNPRVVLPQLGPFLTNSFSQCC